MSTKKSRLKELVLQIIPVIPPMFQATLKSISMQYLDKCDDKNIDEIIETAKKLLVYVEEGANHGTSNKT